MTANEFAEIVIHLPTEQQNELLASLKEVLTEDEYKATATFISLHSIYRSHAKYNALKNAVKAQMVEELFGHPWEEPEAKPFDPCNPVHMTAINSMPM